jgi:DNA-binding IclR family transcriptional regulator
MKKNKQPSEHRQLLTSDWKGPDSNFKQEDFYNDRQFATTLARGLEILHCFTPRENQLGNAELSARTRMSKATVSRFTYTLVRLGYLKINRISGKYQMGPAVLSIGYPLLASISLRQLARPFMKSLADTVNGSVSLGMRDRLNMVYIESSRAEASMTFPPDVGLSFPISSTASGRALLAGYSFEERAVLLNEIKAKSPDEWKAFQGRIEESLNCFSRYGFSVSFGDARPNIHAVGVPMRRTADGEILVFNCGISSFLLKEGQLVSDIGPRLVNMVRSIESMLGLY